MINRRILMDNFFLVCESLKKRHKHIKDIEKLPNYLQNIKELQHQLEILKQRKNLLTKDIMNKNEVILLNQDIKKIEKNLEELEIVAEKIIVEIPNLLLSTVPKGEDENDNVEIFKDSKEQKHNMPHYQMNLVNSAAEITTSRFVYLSGQLATLERGLGNFLINFLVKKKNFVELSVPLMLSTASLLRTGHLPKEQDNMFKIEGKDLYLIPTSECSILNILSNETFKEEDLPKKYTAFTPNFRKEAGASGKDLKGLIRLHQFQKIEMIYITKDEISSLDSLEEMKSNCCEVLNLLGLDYRILLLCSGDTGYNAKITYDIELWMPGMQKYLEISSLSYTGEFQSSKLNIKYVNKKKEKKICHALNGTCFGLGRLLAGILEQYYDADNNLIKIPNILKEYVNFDILYLNKMPS